MKGIGSGYCIFFLAILFLLFFSSGCLDTLEKKDNEDHPDQLTSWPLEIYTEEQPPFNYMNDMGQIAGRSTEVVQKIMNRIGVQYPIHMKPWAEGYNTVLTTNHTALYSTIMTHEREPMFKWVGPIAEVEFSFFTCSDNPVEINTLDDLRKNGKIAVVQSDARDQYLESLQFNNTLKLADDMECIKALSRGDAEFWLGTKDIYVQNVKRTMWENIPDFRRIEIPIMSQRLYIAFNRETPDQVIEEWQRELDSIKEDGTYDLIQSRYMPYICSWVPCTP